MTDIAQLGFVVDTTQVNKATADLNKLDKAAAGAGKGSAGLEKSFEGLSGSLGGLVGITKGFVAAMAGWQATQYIRESTLLAARIETLGVVMKAVGASSGYTSAQMNEAAESVRRMGITTQESQNSIVKMAQAHMDLSKASQLARVAQDAAVIGGINSSEALARIVHGIQTQQTEVLRTVGITVNFEQAQERLAQKLGKTRESLTQTERTLAAQNAVLDEGKNIADAYALAMGTAGKTLSSLARPMEEISAKIGKIFLPAFADGVKTTYDLLSYMDQKFTEWDQAGYLDRAGKAVQQNWPYMFGLPGAAYGAYKSGELQELMSPRKVSGAMPAPAFDEARKVEEAKRRILISETADKLGELKKQLNLVSQGDQLVTKDASELNNVLALQKTLAGFTADELKKIGLSAEQAAKLYEKAFERFDPTAGFLKAAKDKNALSAFAPGFERDVASRMQEARTKLGRELTADEAGRVKESARLDSASGMADFNRTLRERIDLERIKAQAIGQGKAAEDAAERTATLYAKAIEIGASEQDRAAIIAGKIPPSLRATADALKAVDMEKSAAEWKTFTVSVEQNEAAQARLMAAYQTGDPTQVRQAELVNEAIELTRKHAAASFESALAMAERNRAANDNSGMAKYLADLEKEVELLERSGNLSRSVGPRASIESAVERFKASKPEAGDAEILRVRELETRRYVESLRSEAQATNEANDGNLRYANELRRLNELRATGALSEKAYAEATKRAYMDRLESSKEWADGAERAFRRYADEAGNSAMLVDRLFTNSMRNMENALVKFVTTGKFSFKEFANSVIEDLARIYVQKQILGPLAEAIGGLGGIGDFFGNLFGGGGSEFLPTGPMPDVLGSFLGSAKGNAFSGTGNVIPFAKGGLVTSPTLFKFAQGTGLMGEAGAEAIMPLRRMPSGDLGIQAGGGGGPTKINVQVINEGGEEKQGIASARNNGDGTIDILVRLVSDRIAQKDIPNRGTVAQSLERNYKMQRTIGR